MAGTYLQRSDIDEALKGGHISAEEHAGYVKDFESESPVREAHEAAYSNARSEAEAEARRRQAAPSPESAKAAKAAETQSRLERVNKVLDRRAEKPRKGPRQLRGLVDESGKALETAEWKKPEYETEEVEVEDTEKNFDTGELEKTGATKTVQRRVLASQLPVQIRVAPKNPNWKPGDTAIPTTKPNENEGKGKVDLESVTPHLERALKTAEELREDFPKALEEERTFRQENPSAADVPLAQDTSRRQRVPGAVPTSSASARERMRRGRIAENEKNKALFGNEKWLNPFGKTETGESLALGPEDFPVPTTRGRVTEAEAPGFTKIDSAAPAAPAAAEAAKPVAVDEKQSYIDARNKDYEKFYAEGGGFKPGTDEERRAHEAETEAGVRTIRDRLRKAAQRAGTPIRGVGGRPSMQSQSEVEHVDVEGTLSGLASEFQSTPAGPAKEALRKEYGRVMVAQGSSSRVAAPCMGAGCENIIPPEDTRGSREEGTTCPSCTRKENNKNNSLESAEAIAKTQRPVSERPLNTRRDRRAVVKAEERLAGINAKRPKPVAEPTE
jgi:hypothetical protein